MCILNLLRAFNEYMRFKRNLRYLTALDDHVLRDIGLSRTEIVLWAREMAQD